jgi:choline dehydrogenase-like flavoprotein
MRREAEHVAAAAGMRVISASEALTIPGETVHDVGGARMGSDRRTSVLDADNRCWDCPNVFVTDGAAFPSAGWQNPTLTIMALSARAGRSAARMLSTGEI